MKKNRPNEIRKSIDSLTALLICAEKEREWLDKTLNVRILEPAPAIMIANEMQLTDIAYAYKQDIVRLPYVGVTDKQPPYTEKLTIEVNGIKLYTLA